MLQFALPFAAGFASTVVFHRLTTENEIMAMSASGISYGRILFPVAVVGIVLSFMMIFMAHWVMPRFWYRMHVALTPNVARMLISAADNHESYLFQGHQIFADRVHAQPVPPGSDADIRLLLEGVVAIDADKQGVSQTEFSAEYATVDIYNRPDAAYLKIALGESTTYSVSEGVLASAPQATPQAIRIDHPMQDKPKFWTWAQMQQFIADPDTASEVGKEREKLRKALIELSAWRHVADQIRLNGSLDLSDTSGRWRYVISADVFRDGELLRSNGLPIEITEFDSGQARRRATAPSAHIAPQELNFDNVATFTLLSVPSTLIDLRSGAEGVGRWPERLPDLAPASPSRELTAEASSNALLASVARLEWSEVPDAAAWEIRIGALADRLRSTINEAQMEVRASSLQRLALSLTAPILLLLGAVLAMWMRGSVPLQIYILAFVPSILDIILISSGEQMARRSDGIMAPIIMWSGDALLLICLVVGYRRLSRN